MPQRQNDARRQVAASCAPRRTAHTQPPAAKHGQAVPQSIVWRAYYCCQESWTYDLGRIFRYKQAGVIADVSAGLLFGFFGMIPGSLVGVGADWSAKDWRLCSHCTLVGTGMCTLGGFLVGLSGFGLVRWIAGSDWTWAEWRRGFDSGVVFCFMSSLGIVFLLFTSLFQGSYVQNMEGLNYLLSWLFSFIGIIFWAQAWLLSGQEECVDFEEFIPAELLLWCCYRFCGTPQPRELERALRCLYDYETVSREKYPFIALREVDEIRDRGTSCRELVATMRPDLSFGTLFAIASGGGEAVHQLGHVVRRLGSRNRHTVKWLLRSTALETRRELSGRAKNLLCPQHLVRCHAHRVRVSWFSSVTYYGCRVCHQSREFLDWPAGVVAVLDANMPSDCDQTDGTLRVNWLWRRELFDFDRVEIRQVTDDEIERSCVAVGNDTDPVRVRRRRKVTCVVAKRANLSDNTQRILCHTFGKLVTSD